MYFSFVKELEMEKIFATYNTNFCLNDLCNDLYCKPKNIGGF